MSIYKKYCKETFDKDGMIEKFEVSCPDNFNFGYDVIDAVAAADPDKRAVVWCNVKEEERFFSFKDISELSNKAANALRAQGIGKGDRVITVLKRHYSYWYITIALHKLGAIIVPVTHKLTPEDFTYRFTGGRIKAVVTVPEQEVTDKLKEAAEGLEYPEKMFTVGPAPEGFINLEEAIEKASAELERVETKSDDPMAIYFTSGTTGQPKGVMHSFKYPLYHIVTAKYWQKAQDNGLHFTVAETGWAKTSWGKMYGQWLVGSAVMVYDFDNFDPVQMEKVINKYKVTTFCAPPTIYRYMVRNKGLEFPYLKHAVTAGEAMSQDVHDRFEKCTGLIIAGGYGQTETTLLVADLVGRSDKVGSLGKASPMYNVKLIDEDGNEVKAGETGEIVVDAGDGTGVFTGYFDNPELYKSVWTGSLYHTGDTAVMDEEGFIWFEGRADDVIKTGGYRVGPSEIEDELELHPSVKNCAAVGVPDKMRGQAVVAVVELNEGFEASPELKREIRDFCNARLADYKWVRRVEFIDIMPETISGKVRRKEVRRIIKARDEKKNS